MLGSMHCSELESAIAMYIPRSEDEQAVRDCTQQTRPSGIVWPSGRQFCGVNP
jgi:hypothetical protein